MTFRRVTVLLPVLALALAFASCGSDDDEGGGGSSEAASIEVVVTEQGDKTTLEAPASVEAGLVEMTFANDGKGPHDAQIVRVDGDQTASDVTEQVFGTGEGAPTPDWVHGVGGVGTTAPGSTATATMALEPGTYYVADAEASSSPGGEDAIAKLEVTGEEGGGELPDAPARIATNEYGFETSGLKAGKQDVTFDNVGGELHHAIAAPLNEGATLADAEAFFSSEEEPDGPPPVNFEGATGTAVLDGGEAQVTQMEFQPGKYVLVCFISDRAGGPPHIAKGMIDEIEVPG